MARIRTVKPEFWEDEVIGSLSRDARLLFLACFNLSDDEGILRWNAEYLKASAFIYDPDVDRDQVALLMEQLVGSGLILAYVAGKVRQNLGWIVNFLKHQRINRPQSSKLPPPNIHNDKVRTAYAKRDKWCCYLCNRMIPEIPEIIQVYGPGGALQYNDSTLLSMDHVIAESRGGTDYPSNIKSTHNACNKGKCARDKELFHEPLTVSDMPFAVNDSVNNSLLEGNGRGMEEEKEQGRGAPALLTKDQKITIDFAVQHVMAEAVLAGRKIRDVIHEVIGQELTRDPACDLKMIAEQMADSWKRYKAENVNFELSPESFFGRGTWKVPEKWAKDAKPKRPVVDIKQVVADREKEDAEWLDRRTNRMSELKAGGMNPNDVKSTILREGL